MALFFSTDDVIVVPGLMGSTLRDVQGDLGLIWIDPTLALDDGRELDALRLAAFAADQPERDADPRVRIDAPGSIPPVYDLLRADLELRRYSVQIFPFDWRKNIEEGAARLANLIRSRLAQKPRPLHVVAHSQGSLVARRALHLLGAETARRLVRNLVLLGPASFGTLAAAFAIAGSHETIETVKRLGVTLPEDFTQVLQSFTGLYQLLPWKQGTLADGFDPEKLAAPAFWKSGVDPDRLEFGFEWGAKIDTSFFADRTTIVLGDRPTAGAAKFENGKLVPDGDGVQGDGTIADKCARLPNVRAYRVAGAEHALLPMNLTVMAAVRAVLRGESPAADRVAFAAAATTKDKKPATEKGKEDEPILLRPQSAPSAAPVPSRAPGVVPTVPVPLPVAPPFHAQRRSPPIPPFRKLRVFSFDPLLAWDLETLGIADIAIDVPWEADGRLGIGPVGEYVEVVDYDPASGCFYHPVDLSHPRMLAQNGLPPSESNPQFHQQMAYAVSMATIDVFEHALGRRALWAPHFTRDDDGNVAPVPIEETYVPRLRIYPHAMRDANAYYDPDHHALLFGYFPSRDKPGGRTMPGGTVFSCQSFDIIAHETTHALLHGLHRYYMKASNPDVLAFHEAFADVVAMFQHFSHPEVVEHQVAHTRGDLSRENLLGKLAWQFGEALGNRGALRQFLGTYDEAGNWHPKKPDPLLYRTVDEPHARGAILVAAIFQAFLNIYKFRTKDLYRIATGGTGVLPAGDIHPDLVSRLAQEATKSAEHILTMCVRALDYVPPVDLTFGEYLRALITADFDLVRDDDKKYRVAVIDAFRQWGIYPPDVNVLDEAALLWQPPEVGAARDLKDLVERLPLKDWNLRADRRTLYIETGKNGFVFHKWVYANARFLGDGGKSLGVLAFGKGYRSIPRNTSNRPKFEIHSLRPCCRVGPDGQQRVDLVAEVVQRRAGYFDPATQTQVDESDVPLAFTLADAKATDWQVAPAPDFWFRGGCTLIIDPETGEVRYSIGKSVLDEARLARQREFEQTGAMPSLAATYYGYEGRNPFAMLHADE
jgi:hypothetical protein